MSSRIILSIAAWCLSSITLIPSAEAQQISGYVFDAESGRPIADVAITAVENGRDFTSTASDSVGFFVLRLTTGEFTFRLSRLGYDDFTTDPLKLQRGDALVIEFRVGPSAIPIAPLLVRSRGRQALLGSEVFHRRMREQRALGHGRFVTRADIEATSVRDVNNLLARDPSLRIVPITQPGGNAIMSTIDVIVMHHAGRECLPAVFVDGVRITRNDQTDLSRLFQPDRLEGIEIYPNPAFTPPELSGVPGCGAIALWTRPATGTGLTWRRLLIAAGIVVGGSLMIR